MSVALIMSPGYNTINNAYHTFWDQENGNIYSTSLSSLLTPATVIASEGVSAPTLSCSSLGAIAVDGNVSMSCDLNINGNNLDNVLSISDSKGNYGTSGDVLTSGGSGNNWTWQAVPGVSNWSDYQAVSNVDLNGNNILNLSQLSLTGNNQGTAGQVLASGGSSTAVSWVDAPTPATWSQYVATQTVDIANHDITNGGIVSGANFVASNGFQNAFSSPSFYTDNNGLVVCSSLSPAYRQAYSYYVSPNGSNSNNGTFESPFLTIGQALSVTEALTAVDNIQRTIFLGPGSYTNNVVINYNVNIYGSSTDYNDLSCKIIGNVTLQLASSALSLFQNCVNISGVFINGQVNGFMSVDSLLNLNNVYITSTDRCLYWNPSSSNTRLRVANAYISSAGTAGTNPMIEVTNGSLAAFSFSQFIAKGVQAVVRFSGTSTCQGITNCIIENDSTSGSVPGLFEITSTNGSTLTFNNNYFIYGSTTDKSSNPSASGIYHNSTSGNNTVVATYNSFVLQGTTGANYAIQDVNNGTATTFACVFFSNNASLGNAAAIRGAGGVNKFSLQAVA